VLLGVRRRQWTSMEQESVKLDFICRFKIADRMAQQLMV